MDVKEPEALRLIRKYLNGGNASERTLIEQQLAWLLKQYDAQSADNRALAREIDVLKGQVASAQAQASRYRYYKN